MCRRNHSQLVEEDVGHVGVEVLAGMQQHLMQRIIYLGAGGRDHAGLDELRPGPDNSDDVHVAPKVADVAASTAFCAIKT